MTKIDSNTPIYQTTINQAPATPATEATSVKASTADQVTISQQAIAQLAEDTLNPSSGGNLPIDPVVGDTTVVQPLSGGNLPIKPLTEEASLMSGGNLPIKV